MPEKNAERSVSRLRKTAVWLALFFSAAALLPAQTGEADTEAALAYLDHAAARYASGHYTEAAAAVENGISCSAQVADFFYLNALLLVQQDAPAADVLEQAEQAFADGRLWFRFDPAPAALFTASAQVKTGRYTEASALLDQYAAAAGVPADAQLLRCEIAYAADGSSSARDLLSAALRRWPSDSRFPVLFFRMETPGLNGTVPEDRILALASEILSVWNIADNPDAPAELSLLSVPFLRILQPEAVSRTVRRIWYMDGLASLPATAAPFAAVEAFRERLITGGEVLDAFFLYQEEGIPVEALEYLCAAAETFPEPEIREGIAARLSEYGGVLSADTNGDGIADTRVSYRLGRPYSVFYDRNQDGYPEMLAECGFGEPVSVFFPPQNAAAEYERYPYPVSVKSGSAFFFLRPESLALAPVTVQGFDFGFLSPEFFFLLPDSRFVFPPENLLASCSVSSVQTESVTREDGSVSEIRTEISYTETGLPASAREICGGMLTARTVYKDGTPDVRECDSDGDGCFEKQIVYGRGETEGETSVFVDTDGDQVFDYSETFFPDGSFTACWFAEGTEEPVVQWTKNADGGSRAVWMHPESGLPVNVVFSVAGSAEEEPSFSVSYRGAEQRMVQDPGSGVWWFSSIPENGAEASQAVRAAFQAQSAAAVSLDVPFGGSRIHAVKIGGMIFAERE